ncbi:MAG: phage minor capsid protein [Coprobacillaceae bacterium]
MNHKKNNDQLNTLTSIEQQRQQATANGYSLKDIFVEMELELVASLKRNLKRHLNDEVKEGFAWEMWQKSSLRDIERFRKENKAIIGTFSKNIQSTIDEVLTDTYDNQLSRKDDAGFSYPKTNKGLLLPGTHPPQEKHFFGVNDKKMKVLINEMQSSFKKVQSAVYRKAEDIYKRTIFNESIKLNAGTVTLPKAIDQAVDKFLEQGINCIQYADKRMVNVATYAEMALRTASQRAKFLADGSKRAEQKVYTVVVSSHANTCEKCLPWQSKVLIDDVFSNISKIEAEKLSRDTGYKLLSEAIAKGLLHPNCRHLIMTFYPGISRLPKAVDEELALKNYKAEQKQRELENKIRKAKRKVQGYVDDYDIKQAKKDLRDLQKQLREHLAENTQLRRNPSREKIYLKEVKQ